MMEASVKRAAANTNEPVCAENCDTVDSPVASSAPTPATKPHREAAVEDLGAPAREVEEVADVVLD